MKYLLLALLSLSTMTSAFSYNCELTEEELTFQLFTKGCYYNVGYIKACGRMNRTINEHAILNLKVADACMEATNYKEGDWEMFNMLNQRCEGVEGTELTIAVCKRDVARLFFYIND